jgi:hypothetical protein
MWSGAQTPDASVWKLQLSAMSTREMKSVKQGMCVVCDDPWELLEIQLQVEKSEMSV